MNELAMKIKHAKKRGEWAELKFMAAASERGFRVTKPWGETAQYDFVVEHSGVRGKEIKVKIPTLSRKKRETRTGHPKIATLRKPRSMGHPQHPMRRFVRVQVKSTGFKDRGGYSCSVRGSRGAYEGDPFDFVAVYVVPEDVWYIIPEEVVRGQGSVALYPGLKRSKYGKYKEKWEGMR